MKIEELLLTVEQVKHLQELGLDMSDTALCRCRYKKDILGYEGEWQLCEGWQKDEVSVMEYIPTLTLQEILEKIPSKISIKVDEEDKVSAYFRYNKKKMWYDECLIWGGLKPFISSDVNESPIEMAYETLCWVLENGYLKE